ncbi:MAG: 50S ribosomal protein L11 methyltransferase [Niabella sp.]
MHIQVNIPQTNEPIREILIARLAEQADGFEEDGDTLKVFFRQENFDDASISELTTSYGLQINISKIAPQNWNALWESNFDPVVIGNFAAIRADFHEPIKGVAHEIIITPKMSFGTGHHATTHQMISQMQQLDFTGKTVFDFGTGTGILATLAHQLGATSVLATDNDEWSIANARENFERNGIQDILLKLSDTAVQNGSFDIILANINKNVLLETIPSLAAQLAPDGTLLLSGLLREDKDDICASCGQTGLKLHGESEMNNWIALRFKR